MGKMDSGGAVSDFSAWIPHVCREDLLLKAVNSIDLYGKNRTIIDNSPKGLATDDWHHWNGVYVVRPPVPLSCSQTFNWIMRMTRDAGQKICIWMHSDAEASPEVVTGLLQAARENFVDGKHVGVLWTYYDTVCALNTELIDVIGDWDTNLPQYFCDNDYYWRVRLAGWQCIDTNLTAVKHEGSATIKSSAERKAIHNVTFPLYHQYYLQKWGGKPGSEVYARAFNQ